jgi:hypothetical protein
MLLEPRILVYPAQEYALVNAGAEYSLERLHAILNDPSAPLEGESLPQVPGFNAQMMAFKPARIQFKNGGGVRVLAEYAQAVLPINNREIFYQFMGLTSDEQYLVVVLLPINAPFLAASDDPGALVPADGVPFPDINTGQAPDYEAYYQAIRDKMDAADSSFFTPALTALDELIESIDVNP